MLQRPEKNIAVFCASELGNDEAIIKQTFQLGEALAAHQVGLVYGGANVGLMKVVADGVRQGQGFITGIMPQVLIDMEKADRSIDDLIIVGTMDERKRELLALSDAIIMLPGSIGTLDEFFEAWTLNKLKVIDKPCIIANIGGFYDSLIEHVQRIIQDGFLAKHYWDNVLVYNSVQAIADEFLPNMAKQTASVI